MPVQITINGENAAQAHQELISLHSLMSSAVVEASAAAVPTSAPATPAQPAAQYAQQAPAAPAPYQPQSYAQPPASPAYGQAPQQPQYGQQPPAQAPTGAVPTSAPAYSLDQLGVAAQPVMDAGRGQELIGWLQQHGAGALTQLDPALYGEFATFLRSLGARI